MLCCVQRQGHCLTPKPQSAAMPHTPWLLLVHFLRGHDTILKLSAMGAPFRNHTAQHVGPFSLKAHALMQANTLHELCRAPVMYRGVWCKL